MSKIAVASIMFANLSFLALKNIVIVHLIKFSYAVVRVSVFDDLVIHKGAPAGFAIEGAGDVEG